jgi:hypothetical protein
VSPQFLGESIDLAEPPSSAPRPKTTGTGAKATRTASLRSLQDNQDYGPDPL